MVWSKMFMLRGRDPWSVRMQRVGFDAETQRLTSVTRAHHTLTQCSLATQAQSLRHGLDHGGRDTAGNNCLETKDAWGTMQAWVHWVTAT